MTLTLEMAPRVPKPKRNDVPVKLDAEVVRIARIVAAFRGETVAGYLSDKLLPLVRRDLARHSRQAGADEAE